MKYDKCYRVKGGIYLGILCFVEEDYRDGIDRPRRGTIFYFMPNNSNDWMYASGIAKEYTEFFDEDTPDIPDDIEETERVD